MRESLPLRIHGRALPDLRDPIVAPALIRYQRLQVMRSLRCSCVSVTTLAFLTRRTLSQPTAFLAQRRQQQASLELPAPRYIPSHAFDTQNIKLDLRFA